MLIWNKSAHMFGVPNTICSPSDKVLMLLLDIKLAHRAIASRSFSKRLQPAALRSTSLHVDTPRPIKANNQALPCPVWNCTLWSFKLKKSEPLMKFKIFRISCTLALDPPVWRRNSRRHFFRLSLVNCLQRSDSSFQSFVEIKVSLSDKLSLAIMTIDKKTLIQFLVAATLLSIQPLVFWTLQLCCTCTCGPTNESVWKQDTK